MPKDGKREPASRSAPHRGWSWQGDRFHHQPLIIEKENIMKFIHKSQNIWFILTLLALTFNPLGVTSAQAAGIYTHSVFVERAILRLNASGGYSELVDILNRYPAVVNYGAAFPDTTYAGIDDEWAEMLHDTGILRSNYSKFLQFLTDKGYAYNWDLQAGWYKEFLEDPAYTAKLPEFRAALMAQVLDYFNNTPRSVVDEKMIAFLFGLIAHQEADTRKRTPPGTGIATIPTGEV
jgi:hypothetical protein